MEVALSRPISEIIPSLIGWNNEQLMTEARNFAACYKGRVYTDDDISEAKADRALINQKVKNLNDFRIRVKEAYETPYEHFKSEVDEVLKVLKDASGEIDEQVKSFEAKKKEEKLEKCKAAYEERIGEYKKFIPFEKVFKDKWLNVGVKMSAVEDEIKELVDRVEIDIIAINALNSPNTPQITALYFRNLSLSEAIAENERLNEEKKRAEEFATTASAASAKVESKVTNAPEPSEKIYTYSFEASGTLAQMKALKEFFIKNGISYKKI